MKDVTEMSREELEEVVIAQSRQLRTLETKVLHYQALAQRTEVENARLGNTLRSIRQLVVHLEEQVGLRG